MKITATNRPTNHDRQESTGGNNSVYVVIAGEVVNRRSVFLRNIPAKAGQVVLNGKESACFGKLSTSLIRYCTYAQNVVVYTVK